MAKVPRWLAVYGNRRMAALVGLGFASGLPGAWALFGTPLQAWLLDCGFAVKEVTLVGLVSLPFAFNFAWAPLLDCFAPPILGSLGRRRGWLVWIQLLLAVGIALLAAVGPREAGDSLLALTIVGLVVATLAATQDVLCDAYRTEVLGDDELGAGAAVYVNGYRLAMLVAGGGLLYLSRWASWPVLFAALAGVMALCLLATLLAPREPTTAAPATLGEAVEAPVTEFFTRLGWRGLLILLFVIVFKLPDSTARAATLPLLKEHLHFEPGAIALWRESCGLGATLLGALAGGALTAKLGLRRALLPLIVLQLASNLGFVYLALHAPSLPTMAMVVLIEAFCGGLVTAGFVAFLMSLCDRRYTATQYALFTSLNYFTGTLTGAFSGLFIERTSYATFFLLTAALGLPALLLWRWTGAPASAAACPAGDDPDAA